MAEDKDFFQEMTGEKPEEQPVAEPQTEEKEAEITEEAVVEEGVKEEAKEIKEAPEESRDDGPEQEELEEAEPEEKEEEAKEEKEEPEEPELEAEDDLDQIDSEDIKSTILEKAAEESKVKGKAVCGIPLTFLEDEKQGNVFIGRSKSVYQKYGYEGALHVGRVGEEEHFNQDVFLDSLTPHVVFVCGSRGSGKSYVLGVVAEELAHKNKNVGILVVDPIGVFWSMKYPNRVEREVKMLGEWGLEPQGLDNLKVFVPKGVAEKIPDTTYDATFSVQPSLLTSEDWCLTFGIDRFSPIGLLLEKGLQKVANGYKTKEGRVIKGKDKNYSLEDLIVCLENDVELNSKERGFKSDSIRAVVSRFDAAKSWGIFDHKGTPLGELSKENQLAIIDTSFLDDAVTALVIGLLARRILAARKISTRKEAAQKIKALNVEELMEMDIPPTWLFIDEAHTLIPSGNVKTPATTALVEYVKQGRRPGCSLCFATQQPSAIDTKVLSQLDVIISHKLVFDDDVKAVFKRTPTIIPSKYKKSNFIKTLPIGVAVIGDRREETSRAFVMKIRPRLSQHEGRDAITLQSTYQIDDVQAEKLITELAFKKIEREEKVKLKDLEELLASLNRKYTSQVPLETLLQGLEEKGVLVDEKTVSLPQEELMAEGEETELVESTERPIEPSEEGYLEETELMAFPAHVDELQARKIADKYRQKKFLFFGKNESVENAALRHRLIWSVQFDYFNRQNEFLTKNCFIDSVTGEFVHFDKGRFVESKGLPKLSEFKQNEINVLRFLRKTQQNLKQVTSRTGLSKEEAKRILDKLVAKGLVDKFVNEKKMELYSLRQEIDLPPSPQTSLLESIKKLPFVQASAVSKERELYSKGDLPKLLHLLWPNTVIRRISEVYWPIYHITLKKEGAERTIMVDALTGQRL